MNLTAVLQQARRKPALSLVFSAVLIAVAVGLRLATPVTLSYVTFYPAVILATIAGGWIIGVAAMLISTACVLYIIAPLTGSPAVNAFSPWNVGAFWFVCLLIIWLADILVDVLMNTQDKADKLAAAEQRHYTLMRELSHRMKNQYAVILAMARAAGTDTTSVSAFQGAFADRLHSMSRAHDLLTQREWKSVPLRDLISAELEAFSQKDRLELHGDDLWLKEHAVVNLGLALHELATNATKHGAWSGADGKVIVIWTVADGNLLFRWREVDGPPVHPSERRGFCSKMLKKIVPAALLGKGTVDLTTQGLSWTLEVPATCLDTGQNRS